MRILKPSRLPPPRAAFPPHPNPAPGREAVMALARLLAEAAAAEAALAPDTTTKE